MIDVIGIYVRKRPTFVFRNSENLALDLFENQKMVMRQVHTLRFLAEVYLVVIVKH